VPLNLRLSNINSIIEETVELIRQEATENNVEVITVLSIDIPLFRFDPEQLKQAILNLIVNALDATKEGDTIKISTDKFDTKVRITISDTGIGIDEELISDIFKPFFTTKTRGSGLGLACVDRIVKDHKGDVIVKSKKGIGTEITILLPIVN
jgi:signal transduction histidine kinase